MRGVGGGWGALGGESKSYASVCCWLQRALYRAGGWFLDLCDGLLGCPGLGHLALAGGCPASLVVCLLVALPPGLMVLGLQLRFLATEVVVRAVSGRAGSQGPHFLLQAPFFFPWDHV